PAAAAAAVTAGAAVFRAAAATDRRPPQRAAISCAPQSTQKAERCRRDAACFASLHGGLESCAFTTPPHCGQWLTGEFARRWFMFSHGLGRAEGLIMRVPPW